MWMQLLLQALGIHVPRRAKLWHDNIEVKYLSGNHVFHTRNKNIEVDFYFVRERVVRRLCRQNTKWPMGLQNQS